MKYITIILFLISSATVSAGELYKNGTITMVGNTSNGGDDFFIKISGGTGSCTTLVFPVIYAASVEQHARAYSLALTAFSVRNSKVRVYNFTDDNCLKATYIEMAN